MGPGAGEGPCHDAFHSREVVVCPDLEAESPWPADREMAAGYISNLVVLEVAREIVSGELEPS